MKKSLVLFLVAGLCAAFGQGQRKGGGAAPNTLTAAEQKDGWELLFDGQTLGKWTVTPQLEQVWKVVDGAIKCDSNAGPGGTMLSNEDFANFVLKVEFRAHPDINSGVMLRNPRPRPVAAGEKKKGGGGQGYELQIRDKIGRAHV